MANWLPKIWLTLKNQMWLICVPVVRQTWEHRRRSGRNSERDACRAPKVGRCRMGWGMVRVSPLQPTTGVWGSVGSSPSGVQGRAPAENGFWRILKAIERSFSYLYDKNLRETICTPPTPNSGGLVPHVPPWSTPMHEGVVDGLCVCVCVWYVSVQRRRIRWW